MVRKKFHLGDDTKDPAWSKSRDPDTEPRVDASEREYAHDHLLAEWTVKLSFSSDGLPSDGNGFFINIPDITHDVILTAAHNLISPNRNLVSDLRVLQPNGQPLPASVFHIAQEYLDDPTNVVADWGAILLPRTRKTGFGFDFSIKLAYDKTLPGECHISGYNADTMPGHPLSSSGEWKRCDTDQLEYDAKTEMGLSGSPVWVTYKNGRRTVVAVHNRKPTRKGGGSRGSRLTPKVLREVFRWTGASEEGVRVRAKDPLSSTPSPLIDRGLFLNFSPDFPFARVRLGTGTAFDVLPVYVTSNQTFYALAVGEKWVLFQTSTKRKEVVLVDRMEDGCLFRKDNVIRKKLKKHMTIVVGDPEYQLRVEGNCIKLDDEDYQESSEVSFAPVQDDDATYTRFWFEK